MLIIMIIDTNIIVLIMISILISMIMLAKTMKR